MGRPLLVSTTKLERIMGSNQQQRRSRGIDMSSHLVLGLGSCCCSCCFRHCSHLALVFMVLLLVAFERADLYVVGLTGSEDNFDKLSKSFRDPRATFYDFLGVSHRASQDEIKRMFRKLAVKMHPDKLGPFESEEEEGEANTVFVKILQAYETLGDPNRRQKYDLNGMNDIKEEASTSPVEEEPEPNYVASPFDIFVRFGAGRGGFWFRYKGHGAKAAPDTIITLPLTFEEAFEGKSANITVAHERLCRTCGGTGATDPAGMPTCPLCEGKGHAYHLFGVSESNHNQDHHHRHRDASSTNGEGHCSGHENGRDRSEGDMPGYAHAVNTTCKACLGTGKVSDGGCPDCIGRRVKVETETLEVSVPAGVLPGHTITFAGRGTEHPNKKAGNVRVVAVQLAHPRFEREGADLVYKKKISLLDALLGFERMLTLLDGRRVPVVHDQVTFTGYRQELPELGFPVEGVPEKRGSLLIDFEVEFPSKLREAHLVALRVVLTEEEISILEDVVKLTAARKGSSRPGMEPLEYRYTRACSIDDEEDDKESYPSCIPDLLWWARPPEVGSVDPLENSQE